MNERTQAPLLDVEDLSVDYWRNHPRRPFRAVDHVSLSIAPGETVGLVGESGSGKSTIGRAVLGLTPAAEGTIRLDGRDINNATRKERRELSSVLQTVFQDP
jgi:ABC-type oligopeptide transport system ATPase subunit